MLRIFTPTHRELQNRASEWLKQCAEHGKQEPIQTWQFGLPAPPGQQGGKVAAICVSSTGKRMDGSRVAAPLPTSPSATIVQVPVDIIVGWVEEEASEDASADSTNQASTKASPPRGALPYVGSSGASMRRQGPRPVEPAAGALAKEAIARSHRTSRGPDPPGTEEEDTCVPFFGHVKQEQEHDEKRTHGGGKGGKQSVL